MYFLKRVLFLIPLLLVISFLAFGLMRLAPGGPFDSDRVPASPEIERALRAKYHLDEPLFVQYARYLGDLLRGDLGISTKYRNHTVNDIIAQALPISLTLGGLAFLFALGLGIPCGVFMAIRRSQWTDHALGLVSLICVCLPGFIVGPLLVLGLAVRVAWFPVALWESPLHFVLPTVTLGVLFAGKVTRLVRESMTTTLQSEFITAVRAKGLSESAILFKHALRLALLPVVSFSAPMLADVLTGAFVVESIFQIPGLGIFFVNSSLNRDYPLLMGLVLIYASMLLVFNLIADLLLAALDPRIKYE